MTYGPEVPAEAVGSGRAISNEVLLQVTSTVLINAAVYAAYENLDDRVCSQGMPTVRCRVDDVPGSLQIVVEHIQVLCGLPVGAYLHELDANLSVRRQVSRILQHRDVQMRAGHVPDAGDADHRPVF